MRDWIGIRQQITGIGPLAASMQIAVLVCVTLNPAAVLAAPPTLTSLAAIHNLTNEQAAETIPAAFEATVTYYAKGSIDLFVEEGGLAIYVQVPTTLDLVPGDRVLVHGNTRASFRPDIVADSVTRIGHGPIPGAVPASFRQLIRAELDSMRVTVTGRVRSADLVTYGKVVNIYLQLELDGGNVDVTITGSDGSLLKKLLGAEVSVTGSASGIFDSKNQMTGVVIEAPTITDLKILKPAASSPDSLPFTPMDEILQHAFVNDKTERVRVEGTITYYLPGSAVVLQNGTKSLWIETKEQQPMNIGDKATASGFPAVRNGLLTLTSAKVDDSQVHEPVAPHAIGWNQLSSGSDAFDLISIEGQVVKESREDARDNYVLTAGGHVFSVLCRHPDEDLGFTVPPMKQVPVGSTVRVTGISSVSYGSDPFEGPVGFDVLLRSYDDIEVVAEPSWLNVGNLTMMVGVLIIVVFVFGIRVVWTERKARHRNATIAYLERRRGKILEDINNSKPLVETLESITELVSTRLGGTPCWIEVEDGATLGNNLSGAIQTGFRVAEHAIVGRAGAHLGDIFAAFDRHSKSSHDQDEALAQAAGLATLAIETSRVYADLVHRSEFDLLTDVENRFSFERRVENAIFAARHSAGVFGLLYVDLNDFKQVNDNYGHRTGDIYLQQVAARMKHQLRPGDVLARLGGDEFAVLIQNVRNRAAAGEVAQRLEHCFNELFVCEEVVLRGSASIGIAMYPTDGNTKDSLLSAADASMYVVKQTRAS
ncbi:MAG: GGDEF domain-containing protein [Terracidiphilus sp.]|jgi:diguanylate cyclase (GGDEF)-like protein